MFYYKISQNNLKEFIKIVMQNIILRYLGNTASKGQMKYDRFIFTLILIYLTELILEIEILCKSIVN